MTRFKNVELAHRYSIAESTVRNWIKLAKDGKLELDLADHRGHSYVAITSSNIALIEKLVEDNRKYRNSRSVKTLTPKPQFYELFSESQVYDIIRSLEMHHEVPRQYNYFHNGADEWDVYAQRLAVEETPNVINRTITLLDENYGYLERRLAKHKRVNVIDLGPGNVLPAKDLLTRLFDKGLLGRYTAVDLSARMLEIAEGNIKEWFGDRVSFERQQRDLTFERFTDVIRKNYAENPEDSINLVLLLGATPTNFRNPDDTFRAINESIGPDDLLLYTDKMEVDGMLPEWFTYEYGPTFDKPKIAPRHRLVFDLLNIDDTFFEVEAGFDKVLRQRYSRIRLKLALTIQFQLDNRRCVVTFNKGDTILLWRSWQKTSFDLAEQFNRTGFYPLLTSHTDDRQYVLMAAQVKKNA